MSNLNPENNIIQENTKNDDTLPNLISNGSELETFSNVQSTEPITFNSNNIPPPTTTTPLDISPLQLLWQTNQLNPLNIPNNFQSMPFAAVPNPIVKQRPVIPGYLEIISDTDVTPCQCLFHSNISPPISLIISNQPSIETNPPTV